MTATYDGDLDLAHAPLSVTLTLDDELDPDRGGEVEGDVRPGHQVVHEVGVDDRAEDELEARIADVLADVVVAAGGEVVEGDDRVPTRQQGICEV